MIRPYLLNFMKRTPLGFSALIPRCRQEKQEIRGANAVVRGLSNAGEKYGSIRISQRGFLWTTSAESVGERALGEATQCAFPADALRPATGIRRRPFGITVVPCASSSGHWLSQEPAHSLPSRHGGREPGSGREATEAERTVPPRQRRLLRRVGTTSVFGMIMRDDSQRKVVMN